MPQPTVLEKLEAIPGKTKLLALEDLTVKAAAGKEEAKTDPEDQ